MIALRNADSTPTATPLRKALAVLFAVALYFGIQGLTQLLRIMPRIFSPQALADHPWIALYEHHFWQMALALGLIALYTGGKPARWGLNLSNASLSGRILVRFCLVYTLVIMAVNVVPTLMSRQAPRFDYPLTRGNVIGWLAFEWIFVGISEEILFRGLLHNFLARSWRGVWIIRGIEVPTAGVITTLIFCLAHVAPHHLDWGQQAFAFGLGIYYSTVYHRTRSLLNPILAHNFGDGIIFAALYLLHFAMH